MGFRKRCMPRGWRSWWVGKGVCQSSALMLLGAVLAFWWRRSLKGYAHCLPSLSFFFSLFCFQKILLKGSCLWPVFAVMFNEWNGHYMSMHFFIYKVEKIDSNISSPTPKVWRSKEVMALSLVAPSSMALSHSLSSPSPTSHHHGISNLTHHRFRWQLKPRPLYSTSHICHAGEYVFPDPIPEFADAVSTFLQYLLFYCFPSFIRCYYYLILLFVFASSLSLA